MPYVLYEKKKLGIFPEKEDALNCINVVDLDDDVEYEIVELDEDLEEVVPKVKYVTDYGDLK